MTRERRDSLALWPLAAVLTAKCALSFAFAGRYGWQRDELYYAVAGRHLQGGYVDFEPVTALLAAAARIVFGWSLVGFRSFAVLAGAATIVLAALVARELGGGRRAQVTAAALVAFSPRLLSANGLFQPVSFDLAATMLVLWLAVRLALGRGSWLALGVAVGAGLETKYTLVVVLVPLLAGFAAWRRDVLAPRGLAVACLVAGALMAPNLLWEAGHGWSGVEFVLHPPPSASAETRLQYLDNLFAQLNYDVAVVAVLGAVMLWRDKRLRPLGLTVIGVPVAYFLLGGKSYYAGPVVLFALAAGAVPLAHWATRGWRLAAVGVLAAGWAATLASALPTTLPVLPLHTAIRQGVVAARSDYQDELGWPALAAQVGRLAGGADVVVTSNYGEAAALELLGHGLPPVASTDVTFRYWRPPATGRHALLVGFSEEAASGFCRSYALLGRIVMPAANQERGLPIARCTLDSSLAAEWDRIQATRAPLRYVSPRSNW
ncbi:MAG TPA: glycosyltransferase family 39 protein [Gaiellaceae bacterium]|nr:glycosyltransferase family 39 protein [Gaiellaceae bacterium]